VRPAGPFKAIVPVAASAPGSTQPGANITAIFHYKATTASQSSKADKTGRGDVIRNIGGATVAFRVPVTVTVTLGPKTATCSTAFTTIA